MLTIRLKSTPVLRKFPSFLATLLVTFAISRLALAGVPLTEFLPYLTTDSASVINFSDDSTKNVGFFLPFRYFQSSYDRVYIGSNGYLSFREDLTQSNTWIGSSNCTSTRKIPIIMPFWTDIVPRNNSKLTFRQTTDRAIIDKLGLEKDVSRAFPWQGNSLNWILVVTWLNVGGYEAGSGLENTFQVILTSDGTRSFVLFYYNKIQWPDASYDKQPAVGFLDNNGTLIHKVAGSCTHSVNDRLLYKSNVQSPGKWIFRVDSERLIIPEFANEYGLKVQCQDGYNLYSAEKGKVTGDFKCKRAI